LSHSIVKVIYKVKLPNGHRRFALVQASSALGYFAPSRSTDWLPSTSGSEVTCTRQVALITAKHLRYD
jgi:hypothetical protein